MAKVPTIGPHSSLTIYSCSPVPSSGIPSPSTPGSLTAPDPGSPLGPTWGLPPEVGEGALERPFTGAFLPQEPAGDHTVGQTWSEWKGFVTSVCSRGMLGGRNWWGGVAWRKQRLGQGPPTPGVPNPGPWTSTSPWPVRTLAA